MNNNTENNSQNKAIVNNFSILAKAGKNYTKSESALYEAVYDVAQEIIQAAPEEVELPRGYIVRHINSNLGGEYFLLNTEAEDGEFRFHDNPGVIVDAKKGYYLHNDYNVWIDKAPKSVILGFAKDVRDGLIQEIAEFLEKKAANQNEIADELNTK